jgi:hypothetical protein
MIFSILFLFADQNLLAPNLTAAAEDFGFDDNQRDAKLGGELSFAFFTVGGELRLRFTSGRLAICPEEEACRRIKVSSPSLLVPWPTR